MLEGRKEVVGALYPELEAELNGRMMLDLELKLDGSCFVKWMVLQLLGLNLLLLHAHLRVVLPGIWIWRLLALGLSRDRNLEFWIYSLSLVSSLNLVHFSVYHLGMRILSLTLIHSMQLPLIHLCLC